VRRTVYDYVAALTRHEPATGAVPPAAEPYLRKVALNAYKVLDREVDAMRTAGSTTDDIFEMTVAAALSAGVTRMEIALAALEEVYDAPAS
jgi:alkylhydroperoxidase family enzyme